MEPDINIAEEPLQAQLPPRLDPDLQEVVKRCMMSTKFLARHLFSERFYSEFDPPHEEIFSRVDDVSLQKVAVAAPRGVGKTSIVGLAVLAKAVLFQEARYIVYVSNSHDVALMQTENLKRELVSNSLIKGMFGDLKPGNAADDGLDESFTKKAWVANGCFVVPRGSGQQVRGQLYRNSRPDLIIVDDLEDTDTIDNELVRAKRKKWFMDDLMKSVDLRRGHWRIIYIDTVKHQNSLLSEIMSWSDWSSVRLELCDDDLKSRFPHFMSDEDVKKTYNEHVSNGALDSFFQEYRNLVISTEDACYKQSYFRYYEEGSDEFLKLGRNLVSVVLVDPAKTVKKHSAETGIIGWGVDTSGNRLYLRDCLGAKLHNDEIYDRTFEMAIRLKAKIIGIEVTSLEDFIIQPFTNEMIRRGLHFTIVPLKAVGSKEQRDDALVPYYRKGLVYHNKAVSGPLEAQMLSFPKNARWDLLDAANYIIKLMEIGEVYFEPSEDLEDPDKEFLELMAEDEEPIEGWQIA